MNKDEFKGKVENAKGRVKEAAGALTGDKETQAEGMGERFKGAAREKYGEIKRDLGVDEKKTEEKKTDLPEDEEDRE
jgi:uncharacterized protein YjbJ (UPF0337 family)